MSNRLATGTREKQQASCGLCGRTLGKGYYFVCHICGSTYCYVHMPARCDHLKNRPSLVGKITA